MPLLVSRRRADFQGEDARIGLPVDGVAQLAEGIAGALAQGEGQHGVGGAVAHEDGRVGVGLDGGRRQKGRLQLERQQQVRRHGDDAGEALDARDAGEDGHGAALREAAEDDALGRHAAVDLLLHQLLQVVARRQDAGLVFGAAGLVDAVGKGDLLVSGVREQGPGYSQCRTSPASACPC